jgi:capsular exopolysaccharide synthesis family protein
VAASELPDLSAKRKSLSMFTQLMEEDAEVAEAYVALLGALRLSRPLGSGNSILITSAEPGEGKTTVASSLALTASRAGQTVLLVDGDLRRSSLASAAGIANAAGLIEIIQGHSRSADAVHPLGPLGGTSGAGIVTLMSGGRKSSIHLPAVDWAKARSLFKSISQGFAIVLLDSPPVLTGSDAPLLASLVDGILLVVGAGSANLNELRLAKEQLEQTGTPVLGAVLNRFEPKIHGPSNQPYRGYNGRPQQ